MKCGIISLVAVSMEFHEHMGGNTMNLTVDFNKTVYENFKNDKEALHIMEEIGFISIVKPHVFATAGKIMTINQGARLQKISLEKVREAFESHGYTVIE